MRRAPRSFAELPSLTRREREVLVELCRPVLTEGGSGGEPPFHRRGRDHDDSGGPPERKVFIDPASIHEIAEGLAMSEGAVKQHLIRLSEKFGVSERGKRRRVRLANEAIRSGAVTLRWMDRGFLKGSPGPP